MFQLHSPKARAALRARWSRIDAALSDLEYIVDLEIEHVIQDGIENTGPRVGDNILKAIVDPFADRVFRQRFADFRKFLKELAS